MKIFNNEDDEFIVRVTSKELALFIIVWTGIMLWVTVTLTK